MRSLFQLDLLLDNPEDPGGVMVVPDRAEIRTPHPFGHRRRDLHGFHRVATPATGLGEGGLARLLRSGRRGHLPDKLKGADGQHDTRECGCPVTG